MHQALLSLAAILALGAIAAGALLTHAALGRAAGARFLTQPAE